MREILFKAKRKVDGKWFHGFFVKMCTGECALKCPALKYNESIIIDSETLCQFTGKYDKNGTMIFENDIIQIELEDDDGTKNIDKLYIGWDEKECQFKSMSFDDYWDCGWFDERYEVIGNIFDNLKNA